MRFLSIALLLFASLGLAGCEKEEVGQRLEFQQRQFGIPAGLNPAFAYNLTLNDLSTDHARFEAETGIAWEDWSRVTPARASLIINEPGLDWSFAQEVTLNAYSMSDPDVQREIFYRDQIPLNIGNRLDMIPADFDAREILSDDEFGVRLQLRRFNNAPPQSFNVVLQWSFQGFE